MDQPATTRMELLARRNQVKLAQQGSQLLKSKQDALLKEILDMIAPLEDAHADLYKLLRKAVRSLTFAEALDGRSYLNSLSIAGRQRVNVDVSEETIWGVRVPVLKAQFDSKHAIKNITAPSSMSARASETITDFERLLENLMAIIPLRIKLDKLGSEFKKTSRRVNALEQVLMPRLKNDIQIISRALEEREREDVFRLRRIKSKRGRAV